MNNYENHDDVKRIIKEFGKESPAFTVQRLRAILKITD